jgi:hypothetical protein
MCATPTGREGTSPSQPGSQCHPTGIDVGEDCTMAKASRFDGQLRWMHKVWLYPTCAQERTLIEMLRVTRELYNAMLQQRRDSWKTRRVPYTSKPQYAEITELRACEPRFAAVCRQCEDAALHRLDLTYAAIYRRHKAGENPGFPRFKSARRWNQLTFLHGELALRFEATARLCTRRRSGAAAQRAS